MKVTTESTGKCEITLTIEAETSEIDESLDKAYERLVQRTSVPGFRKGKAPKDVLERHVGKSNLLERALEHLIPRLYNKAIEQEKLEPIDDPRIEVVQTEPVVFKSVVPLKPEVKLGDYHSIKLDFKPVEVGEEEIETALEQIRQGQAVLIPVDRPIELGDLVTIDVEVTVEGKSFLNRKDMLYEVNETSNLPLPGVAQNLVGVKKNEERTFTINVPDDYPIKDFAGKSYFFKVTPNEIKVKELPGLDDELAQSAGYDDLAAMKEKVTAMLRARAEERNRLELRGEALDAVVELSEVCYHSILEDREIERFVADEARRLGFKTTEDYLRTGNRTKEEYMEQLRPIIKKRISRSLVLDGIAEQEKVEIDAKEVDNRIEKMIENSEDKEKAGQFFALAQIRKSVEESLKNESTIERLVQMVSNSVEEKTKEV